MVAQLVAHHAEFDGTSLREWFERLGLFLPASYRVFCTMHRAMWLFHEDPSLARPTDYSTCDTTLQLLSANKVRFMDLAVISRLKLAKLLGVDAIVSSQVLFALIRA